MVASGYFSDAKDVAQAVVKIMAGQEMGIAPFASMTGIHIIKGKPALGANLIASKIKNDPRYDYRVKTMTDKEVVISFYENGNVIGESGFTASDAQRAGTQNMGKFPRNMLFARAMSNGAKWFTPGIFGGAPVYTPDELGADVDDEGEIIDVTPEPGPADITDGPEYKDQTSDWVADNADDNGQEPADKPLADDELVIYEASAGEFFTNVVALIDRYDNVPHTQNALKQLGYTGVPRSKMKRVEMYRALKELAAQRDAEEAKDVPLFEDEATAEMYSE